MCCVHTIKSCQWGYLSLFLISGGLGQDQGRDEVQRGCQPIQRGQGQTRGITGMDDKRIDGGTVPRGSLRSTGWYINIKQRRRNPKEKYLIVFPGFQPFQPRLHRSSRQDQVRLSHHHGRGKEVTEPHQDADNFITYFTTTVFHLLFFSTRYRICIR